MRKLIAIGIAVLLFNSLQAQKVNRQYTFQPQPGNSDIPSSFVELSDGTIMLIWTSFHFPVTDSCYIRARKILKTGVAGPIMTLDAFPYQSGNIRVESAALSKGKLGLIYQVPVPDSKKCSVVFSSFTADGTVVQKRKAIANSFTEKINRLAISSAPDGKYAIGWQEFADEEHSRFMVQTFDAKDQALAVPFAFDSLYSLSCDLQQIDFKNGKLVIALLDQKANEIPKLCFRTFTEKGIPVSAKTIVNESADAGTTITDIETKFISSTEFVLSWLRSPAGKKTEEQKNKASEIVACFYDLKGKMSSAPKTLVDSAEVISSLNMAVVKGKLQFAWLDEKEETKQIHYCTMDKTKRAVPDSVYVLEKKQATVVSGTVICRPTSKYKFFEFNQESIRYSDHNTLSYGYYLWKEKKPKTKKVKEPKKKKDKKPEEKKENKKNNSGNGRG